MFQFAFSSRGGVHAACRGDSRGYPRVGFALHAGTHGLSLDNPRLPRSDLFEVDAHPKNQLNVTKEVSNS